MIKLFGNKKILLLLFILILFIMLMGLTLGSRDKITFPERVVKDSMTWTIGLFNKPARAVADFFADVRAVRNVYKENKVLKQTISLYAWDTMRLNDLEAQNKKYKELLEFTERQKQMSDEKRYRIAEVIGYSPDPYSNVVNIDLGAKDGIKENMAVMSVDGLIGRIHRVSDYSSTVQLLTEIDETNLSAKPITAAAKGKEDSTFGIIEKYDAVNHLLIMNKIPPQDDLQVGDVIVTSGLGQVFPRGIEIGKVVAKELGDFGITYKATIEPFASFVHLREVVVVEMPE